MPMKNEYSFDDITFDDMTDEQYSKCLTEADFYPPADNRTLKSNVKDIYNGDNFADYCEYIFDLLEEEGCYE